MGSSGVGKTRTTIPGKDGRRAGDLLNRDFTAPAPNQVRVTDFTYVPVYAGFVYGALVIDLHSRAIVGWETSTVKDTAFVEQCLRMALWRRQHTGRPVPDGMIHHSDAGRPVHVHPLHRHTDTGGLAAIVRIRWRMTMLPRRPSWGCSRTRQSPRTHPSGPGIEGRK